MTHDLKAINTLAAQPAASAEPSDEEAAKFADQYGMYYDQDASIAGAHARALLSRYGRPAGDAQPVAAQETYPQMMPAELSQFLSDVMTAAGLVSHGKQCKALGERLGDACMRLRLHYQEPFAAPVAAQGANAAVAAIQFALEADDGMTWLRCWNEGDFDACRNEWPGTPEECFIGADPLHPSTRAALAVNKVDDARDALRRLVDEKFSSGNAIPVERITITRQEYAAIAQQRQGEGGE